MRTAVRERPKQARKNSNSAHNRANTILRRNHTKEYEALKLKWQGVAPVHTEVDGTLSVRLYSVGEAAERIGVHRWTLRDWREKRKLVPSFVCGSKDEALYSEADIERGLKLVGVSPPGRRAVSGLGWKTVHNNAMRDLRKAYEEEYKRIVEALK